MELKCYLTKNCKTFDRTEIPKKATDGASGFDIEAFLPYGGIIVYPKNTVIIPTGLRFDIPCGYEIEIRGRSGLLFNNNIVIGHGTIDSDYTGEVMIHVTNNGNDPFDIKMNDRIAQAVVNKLPVVTIIEGVGEIKETERGDLGFGHTGV